MRHVRQLRGYTQLELARLANLSQSAVASYESAERKSSRALFKLAAALGVEAQWLETGKGPMEKMVGGYGAGDAPAQHAVMENSAAALAVHSRIGRGDWPFPGIAQSRYDALTPRDKRHLETMAAAFIDACIANYTAAKNKSRRGT